MTNSTWQSSLPNYDPHSYHAGVTAAFAEVVAAGVKPLALSHPYTAAELAAMQEPTRQIAAEYSVVTFVEADLLVTPLFPADIAAGKFVILLAQNEAVLADYHALKQRQAQADADPEAAIALAWDFGRLLGYSESTIALRLQAGD